MAHYKRKRPRSTVAGNYSANGLRRRLGIDSWDGIHWLGNWPRWWDKMHHTRPARREGRSLETKILRGHDPDDMVWPDGRKPHSYYW